IPLPQLEAIAGAQWFPDGKRVLLWANAPGEAFRGWTLDLTGTSPKPITPAGITIPAFLNPSSALAPDGRTVVALDAEKRPLLFPVDGGAPHTVSGVLAGEEFVAWAADGRGMFVRKRSELPNHVYRLDLATGHRELWKEIMPGDPAGVIEITNVLPTRDGRF